MSTGTFPASKQDKGTAALKGHPGSQGGSWMPSVVMACPAQREHAARIHWPLGNAGGSASRILPKLEVAGTIEHKALGSHASHIAPRTPAECMGLDICLLACLEFMLTWGTKGHGEF